MDDVAHASNESIHRLGAAIRHHPDFPQGINVNFVQVVDAHTLWQRTFERGVEGETLACGAGAVASSVISALLGKVDTPVRLRVLGGELRVSFKRKGDAVEELRWVAAHGSWPRASCTPKRGRGAMERCLKKYRERVPDTI